MDAFSLLMLYAIFSSFICSQVLSSMADSSFRNETDRLALIKFKAGINRDPLGALISWNDSVHFCAWQGVSCSVRHQRVTALNLPSKSLEGFMSAHIGNLTFLRTINLANNNFRGLIPPQIGFLYRLQILQLSNNSFQGELPINLTHCSHLRELYFVRNNVTGNIPSQLTSLSKLEVLDLHENSLTGTIPPSLGNISSLAHLNLLSNRLEGRIPEELGRIKSLRILYLASNKLIGTVASSLYNLSSLIVFSVADNQLEGNLPWNIGLTLPKLRFLNVFSNQFTGNIPVSLTNASELEFIIFSRNQFTGPVLRDLGKLQNLYRLILAENQLGNGEGNDLDFISSLTNCTRLRSVTFAYNLLRGSLPNSMANLSSSIIQLSLSENQIYGDLPSGIENLVNLTTLYLGGNHFTGNIPASIGRLGSLQELWLHQNMFSSDIPPSLGNLTMLISLSLSENNLTGTIPSSLEKCQHLQGLLLSNNHLHGSIPKGVIGLSSISQILQLAGNALTGSLPAEVGKLQNLGELDISDNRLSGNIPSTISSCVRLEHLQMAGNSFDGEIPQAFRTLRAISYLDLSRNNFSGSIPSYLEELQLLINLNLSFNNLEGEVPKPRVFENASAISILGNSKLCGGITELKLPNCLTSTTERKGKTLKVIIPVTVSALFLILSVCFFFKWRKKSGKKLISLASFNNQILKISYADLHRATDNFSDSNLIGFGSHGSVYRGVLLDHNGQVVAVKVLNLHHGGASKSFISECKALKDIRHRNLLKILSVCSSIDFQGNDFKALVFNFMPNKNLDKWLHPEAEHDEPNYLSLLQRLNIAIDVASALEYLHCCCQDVIVHRDLKPSNVLLDGDMTAHVGDFGIAKLISSIHGGAAQGQTSSTAVMGTVGYVAPEYGVSGEVFVQGDIYSYGILLLEMFTGRRPTDEMFKDNLTLPIFVKMALPERVLDVVDPKLIKHEAVNSKSFECFVSVMSIGISCSMESPGDRMMIRNVVPKLEAIKNSYEQLGVQGRERFI